MNCPECNAVVLAENINVATDVGKCQNCELVFVVSENLSKHNDGFDINNPPKGAWIRNEIDHLVIGASTRTPIAFFLVPFGLIWSGGSLVGIYGSQLLNQKFEPLFFLFGIPFLLGSIFLWSQILMTIWGKVELTLDSKGGKILTGVGKFGYERYFTWDEIATISEGVSQFNSIGNKGVKLMFEGVRRVSFGTGLNEERRFYLLKALRIILLKVKSGKKFY